MCVLGLIQPFSPLRQMSNSFSQQLHCTKKLPSARAGQGSESHRKDRKAESNTVSKRAPTERKNHASTVGGKKRFLLAGSLSINPCKQLCLQNEWADVGSKQMLKLGPLSTHRQAIFKLGTKKQTLVMWVENA